ncbi:MAG: DNA replication and repair protein RecF [Chloroflexi bacterium]|nr:DNA replication and repair protein RecF [Chloroflexota bacterium]MCI0644710.1 DNA replication and repair protein RecF [Chloroflexota bacterium]MCI0726683.1 DNA replication and repair protein RecF [Chloroflexota bacterium]
MHINHLSLTSFRNYGRLELDFPAGPVLLHGANAQGKTNLLEAIYYLATARSPHVEQDHQLINWEADQPTENVVVGRLVAQLSTRDDLHHIEIRLIKEYQRGQFTFRREALVERRKVRLMDLLGNLRAVLFLPQDVQLITGPPSRRRRYLDITLCQVDPIYCHNLSTYNKVLEQRNALLRRIAESGKGRDVLPVFTEKLVDLGSYLFTRRATFVASLARQAQRIHYEELTDGRETIRLNYLPRLFAANSGRSDEDTVQQAIELAGWLAEQAGLAQVTERFHQALAELQPVEIASGMTHVGPHRDDWRFWVNGRDLSSYGSRGQQRSAILGLKLAEINWMTAETGETPILLLDEVVAELDEQRRALLLNAVQSVSQAILTATDPGMFTEEFLNQATTMTVQNGRVLVDRQQPAAA